MNNQFATQYLLQEHNELFEKVKSLLIGYGANEDNADMLANAVEKEHITFQTAIDIVRATVGEHPMREDGAAAAAPAGGSATGGGVTNGASFTAGTGEQYAAGTRKKKYQEDAPRLAGGKKANISTYTKDGFTKAPTAQEAGKKMKSIDVKDLWEEESLQESRGYSQFKRETSTRSKPDQMHQAAKLIDKRLEEITRLLEFTSQMKTELSEGEDTLEYKHNTKKVFEKIHSKVLEVYSKVKNLK